MSEFWRALLDAIEHLFGKVGAAAFLASAAFLWLPADWLNAIGVNSHDPVLRRIVGIALLCSAAACIVSLSIKLAPTVRSAFEDFGARREFNSIPLESRVLLGMLAQFETTTFSAPAASQTVQCLIDRGYMEASSMGNDLKVFLRPGGKNLIARNRAELRKTAAMNIEIADTIRAEARAAEQRLMEGNKLSWMAQ